MMSDDSDRPIEEDLQPEDPRGKKVNIAQRPKKAAWIIAPAIAVLFLCMLLISRGCENKEISRGREYLLQKKYDKAKTEFVRILEDDPYDPEARGLFIFSDIMQKYPINPIEHLTGADAETLSRIIAAKRFADAAGSFRRKADFARFVRHTSQNTRKVRENLAKNQIPTRNWHNADEILTEFSKAAIKYIDPGLIQKNDPEREILDFAAVTMAGKGSPQAMEYLIDRLEESSSPIRSASLVNNRRFTDLLKQKAVDKSQLSWSNSVEIIARKSLYTEIGRLSRMFGSVDSPSRDTAELLSTVFQKHAVFSNEMKPYEELGGANFDPTRMFWKIIPIPDRHGNEAPDNQLAWVYGFDTRKDRFVSFILFFSKDLKWKLVKFAGTEKDYPNYHTYPWPAADVALCNANRELAMNIPKIVPGKNGEPAIIDRWHVFNLELDKSIIKNKKHVRPFACGRKTIKFRVDAKPGKTKTNIPGVNKKKDTDTEEQAD